MVINVFDVDRLWAGMEEANAQKRRINEALRFLARSLMEIVWEAVEVQRGFRRQSNSSWFKVFDVKNSHGTIEFHARQEVDGKTHANLWFWPAGDGSNLEILTMLSYLGALDITVRAEGLPAQEIANCYALINALGAKVISIESSADALLKLCVPLLERLEPYYVMAATAAASAKK
jgi:hypothetical protein